jgi:uncharacterized membrane protein
MRTLPRVLLVVAILAYAIYFTQLTLVRYWAFEARALDMGNFHQTIWNTWQGRPFHLTNQEGVINRLSLHVEPILVPISWLYWIHSGPETLLVLQAVVVALGALPLFVLARRQLRNEWLALLFAVAFLLHPAMQAANWLEFHAVTLAPTFLLAAFYFLLTARPGWFALFAVLTASCKEEMALLVFMLGLYALVFQRRRAFGLWTMGLSLSWSLLAVLVIQDHFAAGNIHWERYAYLGDTPLQMLIALLTRPDLVLAQLQSADALLYVLRLLLPVAFLALLAPEILLLALPSLAINLLADFPPMHQVDTLIYAAPIVPFVMVAGVFGAARLLNGSQRLADARTARRIQNSALGTSHSAPHTPAADRAQLAPMPPGITTAAIALFILLGVAIDQRLHGYLPWGGNHLPLTVTQHHRNAADVIAQIPSHARVSAQDRLNPHVAGRETVYIFPRIDDADTIFLDVTGPAWPQHPVDLKRTVDELMRAGFGVAAAQDGYLLLRRNVETAELPAEFYSAWRVPLPAESTHDIDFGDALRLRDVRVETDRYGELIVQLVWQLLRPLEEDVHVYVAYLDAEMNILHDTQFYPPVATLWYPTSSWEPSSHEGVLVQTLPWTLETEQFTLALGVYRGEEWYSGERWPLTRVEPALPVLEGGTLVRLGGYQRTADGDWAPIPLAAAEPSAPRDARLGEHVVLDGVRVPDQPLRVGQPLEFALHWRTEQPLAFDYAAFVHLLDESGEKVAQLDWQPHDAIGQLPASAWLVGQPVVDRQTLALPDSLPPGSYRLIAGLYDWRDGTRLPTRGADAVPGNAVLVGTVEVR